jgi:hypothetical protein
LKEPGRFISARAYALNARPSVLDVINVHSLRSDETNVLTNDITCQRHGTQAPQTPSLCQRTGKDLYPAPPSVEVLEPREYADDKARGHLPHLANLNLRLRVDQHVYHKENYSNLQMNPQTKRNSGTSAVLRANFAGCLRVPWATHPRARLSVCASCARALLCSRPPVLAPSCARALLCSRPPVLAPSCARALLPCASRPAPRPLAGASHSRSVLVPRYG